jgi:uncharacterized protein YcfJ
LPQVIQRKFIKKMPESKSRHPQKHVQKHVTTEVHNKSKKGNKALLAAVLFFSVLGFCIGLFINATSLVTLASATIVGALAGYFAGVGINKSLEDSKTKRQ